MGLFNRTTYQCVICGTKVNKKAIQLKDEERLCAECDAKVSSDFVVKNYRGSIAYGRFDTKDMKQLHAFYKESKDRAAQFTPTLVIGELIVDQTHGWFLLQNRKDEIYKQNVSTYDKPLEILSVDHVQQITYGYSEDPSFNTCFSITYRNFPLPYEKYPYLFSTDHKFLESTEKYNDRIRELAKQLKEVFPNAKIPSPEEEALEIFISTYKILSVEAAVLNDQRIALNKEMDMLMCFELPSKTKAIASQYLQVNNLLSESLQRFSAPDNFENYAEMKSLRKDIDSYFSRMQSLYQEIQMIITKELDKKARKMKRGF